MNDLIGKNVKTLKRQNQYDVKILYTQYLNSVGHNNLLQVYKWMIVTCNFFKKKSGF